MEKKDMSPLEEVLEYTKQKVQEGKENVDETLEQEARRIQDIIEFAKSKIDEVSEEGKTALNEIIAFCESKLEQIEEEIVEAKETAQDLAEVVVKEGEEVKEKIEKSGYNRYGCISRKSCRECLG